MRTGHRSGLFEILGIVELAKRMIEKNGDYSALNFRHGSIGTKFGDSYVDPKLNALSQSEQLDETFSHLGENGTWIKLVRVQSYDSEYAQSSRYHYIRA